jgi:hypothetical protein
MNQIMDQNPGLNSPELDFPDFLRGSLCTDLDNGDILGLPANTGFGGMLYLRTWITDEAKANFEAEYGYEMVDPAEYSYPDSITEWTWQKMYDYIEFFHEPEADKYGFISWGKTTPERQWHYFENNAHCCGALSKYVEWPEIELGYERDDVSLERIGDGRLSIWITRPFDYSIPVGFAVGQEDQYYGTSPVGDLLEHGGNVNGVEMQAQHEFWTDVFNDFSAEVIWECDPVTALATEFIATGQYWTTGPTWASGLAGWCSSSNPSSVIGNDFWVCEAPYMPYFQYGMPTHHDDLSQWSITGGCKNPEATWIYSQFCMSKSIELEKVLRFRMGGPVRKTTWEAMIGMPKDDYDFWNADFGGMWDLVMTEYFWHMTCTSPTQFDRPGICDAVYGPISEGLREKWSGEKTMTLAAEAIEELMDELGIMDPDLRPYVEREPWRETYVWNHD